MTEIDYKSGKFPIWKELALAVVLLPVSISLTAVIYFRDYLGY